MEIERSELAGVVASGRYRILAELGSGGTATVHRAFDTVRGRDVALKRLRTDAEPEARRRGIVHLEREFNTLSQLAHPRVVSVYDYGVDGDDPYYTMELLDGGDLQARSPLDWRTACGFASDICSALSLMHSRRLVHRDLSPRNVRCTSDGRAKLIDFGAMVPMGPSKSVVGTPAVCAPELVRLQSLDGRTDLYALGATLYFTLTGRYPYSTRSFTQLESSWKQRPLAPSELVSAIPPALDALVMDLLQLEAALRPSTASEVMQRLCAVAGLVVDEQLLVSQAYLSTPNLVGRDGAVARVRKYASALVRGQGRGVLVQGEPGAGRTRLLDVCALEGKLAGATVVRADPADALDGELGVARALVRRLLETAEQHAIESASGHWSTLAAAFPELRKGAFEAARSLRPGVELQSALQAWLQAFCALRPLMIVVDDLERIDAASASLIALLTKEAREHRLLVATSMPTGGHTASLSLRLVAEASSRIELAPLTLAETETLLRSVFGDVPNVQMLSARLHEVSDGRPLDLMQLAQHLVDKSVVRYGSGAWSLPSHVDTASLPATLAQARLERVLALSPDARVLAQSLVLSGDAQIMTLEECCALAESRDPLRVMRCLDELMLAGVVIAASEQYGLASQGFSAALLHTVDPALASQLHARIAEVFARREDGGFWCALHLFEAGEHQRGLDVLIAHAEASQKLTDSDTRAFVKLLNSMPRGWLALYDRALELSRSLDRPARQRFILQRRVLGLAVLDAGSCAERRHYVAPLMELSRCCGLDLYAQLDPALDPKKRLQEALAAAKRRFEAQPEHERVLDPIAAAAQLARCVLTVLGACAISLDLGLLRLMPSLEPLIPLSPGVAIVHRIVEAVAARLTGRSEHARAMYMELLEDLARIDRASLDETYRATTETAVYFALATVEAALGLDSALTWIERIANRPLNEINVYHARGLYNLWRCNPLAADRARAQAELLLVKRALRSQLEGMTLLRELAAHAACDDLTRLKHAADGVETLARSFPQWQPVLHYARGEHARIRGDLALALKELETGLTLALAGEHQVWSYAAGAQVQVLRMLERDADARACGEDHLTAAEHAQLGYALNHIRLPLALACARNGDDAAAERHATDARAALHALGAKGLNAVLVHEMLAWLAIWAKDRTRTEQQLAAITQQTQGCTNYTLAARHERIRRAALRAFVTESELRSESAGLETELLAALTACATTKERAQCSLDILLAETGSTDGFLYAITNEGCVLAVIHADHDLPAEIDMLARKSLAREGDDDANTGELDDSSEKVWVQSGGRWYRSILLSHQEAVGFVVTGLGLVVGDPDAPFKNTAQLATQLSRCAGLGRDAS